MTIPMITTAAAWGLNLIVPKLKTWALYIAAIVICILLLLFLFYREKSIKTDAELLRTQNNYRTLVRIAADSIYSYKSKSGSYVARVNELEYTVKQLKDQSKGKTTDPYIQEILKVCNELGIKPKNVKEVLLIGLQGGGRIVIKDYDTIYLPDDLGGGYELRKEFKDCILSGTVYLTDSTTVIDYKQQINLDVATYKYKDGKWFLVRWFESPKVQTDVLIENCKSGIDSSKIIINKNINYYTRKKSLLD